MNRGWILVAAAAALVACNKSDDGTSPAASTTPAESAVPAATASAATAVAAAAAAAQPTLDDHGNIMDPSLPPASDSEDTSDITAASYKKALDGLDKEVAGLK